MPAPFRRYTLSADKSSIIAAPTAAERNQAVAARAARASLSGGGVVEAFQSGLMPGQGGVTGLGGVNIAQAVTSSNVTIPVLGGILGDDRSVRNRIFKDIYYHDPISGASVDTLSSFFGNFHLGGIKDQKVLQKYEACCACLRPASLLPLIAREYLVMGQFLGTKIWDPKLGIFTGIIPQDIESVTATQVPVAGHAPLFDLNVGQAFQEFLNKAQTDPRAASVLNSLPGFYKQALAQGSIPLPPAATIFLPRQTLAGDYLGTSLYERILAVWLIQKPLTRGTIDAAGRRQRPILHVSMGIGDWVPNDAQLMEMRNLFLACDTDPQGSVLVTRDGVQISDVKQPNDFWSVDMIEAWAANQKYTAYGISPEIVNGSASMSTLDASISIFSNMLRQRRAMFAYDIFTSDIFADIAVANKFFKKDRRFAVKGSDVGFDENYHAAQNIRRVVDLGKYEIPQIIWDQSLSPEGDSAYLDLLRQASDIGVPIHLATYAAAASQDLTKLMEGLDQDVETRKKLAGYFRDVADYSPQTQTQLVNMQVENMGQVENAHTQLEIQQAQEQAGMGMGQAPDQTQAQIQAQEFILPRLAALAAGGGHAFRSPGLGGRDWEAFNANRPEAFHNTDSVGRYRLGDRQSREMRRDKALKAYAAALAENARRENYYAKNPHARSSLPPPSPKCPDGFG